MLIASHPVRGAWIEIAHPSGISGNLSSHPVRGAWIEMIYPFGEFKAYALVAPREGCVD